MKSLLSLILPALVGITGWSCQEAASQQAIRQNYAAGIGDHTMDSVGAVSWLARSSNLYYLPSSDPSEFYVYLAVKGNQMDKQSSRVPLNISLVLDRSGSMGGDKIEYAKKAASFVVQQLNDRDILSVVNYDDEIELTSGSQPVKNKEVILQKIDALTARGSTNLTGGMLEGYRQAEITRKDGYVNRVLLLTDGLANEGIVEPQQIKKLVESRYNDKGIALSTFGLGADYNEDLLTLLAEVGRANYYFIESADKIPAIFASELKGLLTVVAQNALVQVKFPNNLQCVDVFGYPYEIAGSSVKVKFNDVFSGDQKAVLFKFRINDAGRMDDVKVQCGLQFTDAADFSLHSENRALQLLRAGNRQQLKSGEDSLVQEMISLFESTRAFDEILSDVDNGNYQDAKRKANNAVKTLKEQQKYTPSAKLKSQEIELENYSREIDSIQNMKDEEKKIYQKGKKSENYRVKTGKKN